MLGRIHTPKNLESIIFSNFQAKELIIGQESILFITKDLIILK